MHLPASAKRPSHTPGFPSGRARPRGFLQSLCRLLCLCLACFQSIQTLARTDTGNPPREPHWAYQPLQPRTPPMTPGSGINPIDAFIQQRLAQAGLTQAPPAPPATLLRRLYFDLIGLPPSPEEIDRFTHDGRPDAYERVVEHLLHSPRHGERWARHWIDAVHFAETHGHDQDRIRTNAWPYRDFLIHALNTDLPYATFIQQQVAGDATHPADPWATVALGFLAAGPWDESSLRDIREDTLDRQAARYIDRDDMLATVFGVVTGTTVQCARCHDHKFDPISQREYYALQAVLSGSDRANRAFDPDPALHQQRQAIRRQLRQLDAGDPALLDAPETRRAVAEWERQHDHPLPRWSALLTPTVHSASNLVFATIGPATFLAQSPAPPSDRVEVRAASPIPRITGIRLVALPHPSLPANGPGLAPNGNFHLSEFTLHRLSGDGTSHPVRVADAGASHDQAGWTIQHALDAMDRTAWGIHPREGESHAAVFRFAEPLALHPDDRLLVSLLQLHGGSHILGHFQLEITGDPIVHHNLPPTLSRIRAIPPPRRTAADRHTLASHVLRENLTHALSRLPPPHLVYAAANDFEPDGSLRPSPRPRPIHLLRRGEITQPVSPVTPASLECIQGLPGDLGLSDQDDDPTRRAALARWLTHRDNALTWRSIVNRTWQHHFGQGLVRTSHDLGRMGEPPSHPQLLDWLAIWFRDEARGSLRALHRLIVTSRTYRQATTDPPGDPLRATLDPDNRLLSRMNRSRLDAECVRDALLHAANLLDLTMGGPGDRHFDLQPGIHVTPRVDYARFDPATAGPGRRSIYRFLFRTLPDPFFEALDCPAGDQQVDRRLNSVTVQQALALWNSSFATHMADALARSASRSRSSGPPANPDSSNAQAIQTACRWLWGRPPNPTELHALAEHARQHGLANACRVLVNSSEFLFLD